MMDDKIEIDYGLINSVKKKKSGVSWTLFISQHRSIYHKFITYRG